MKRPYIKDVTSASQQMFYSRRKTKAKRLRIKLIEIIIKIRIDIIQSKDSRGSPDIKFNINITPGGSRAGTNYCW